MKQIIKDHIYEVVQNRGHYKKIPWLFQNERTK